jgi:hypothetical protein
MKILVAREESPILFSAVMHLIFVIQIGLSVTNTRYSS